MRARACVLASPSSGRRFRCTRCNPYLPGNAGAIGAAALLTADTAIADRRSTRGSNQSARVVGPFIETRDGTQLFYRDWGSGSPLVFLSGWALTSDCWGCQMGPLSDSGLRCIAYDRRGHGRSSDPGRGFDYDSLADDLAAVLDALDLKNVTLVTHSNRLPRGAGEGRQPIDYPNFDRAWRPRRVGTLADHGTQDCGANAAHDSEDLRRRAARAVPHAHRAAEQGPAGVRGDLRIGGLDRINRMNRIVGGREAAPVNPVHPVTTSFSVFTRSSRDPWDRDTACRPASRRTRRTTHPYCAPGMCRELHAASAGP